MWNVFCILNQSALLVAGEVKKNHDILREAYSLCYRLPVLSSKKFTEDYYTVSVYLFLWDSVNDQIFSVYFFLLHYVFVVKPFKRNTSNTN